MVSKGNHPRMAEQFTLAKNIQIYPDQFTINIYIYRYIVFIDPNGRGSPLCALRGASPAQESLLQGWIFGDLGQALAVPRRRCAAADQWWTRG